jgi:hypothetical protein
MKTIGNALKKASLISLLLLPLLAAPLAYASPPATATGTYTFSVVYTGSRSADGNTIYTFTATTVDSGGLNGILSWSSGTLVTHADGTTTLHGSGTYTGTVLGSATGTMQFSAVGQGVGSTGQGSAVFVQGTGGLAGLTVQGTFVDTFTSATNGFGTYTFQVVSH